MPPFYRLSDADIDAIIGYIRSWKTTTIPQWHEDLINMMKNLQNPD